MCAINPRWRPNHRKYQWLCWFYRYTCRSKNSTWVCDYVRKMSISSNHGWHYLVSKIQDGSQLTGSSNISETMIYHQNSNGEPTACDRGKLARSVPRRF